MNTPAEMGDLRSAGVGARLPFRHRLALLCCCSLLYLTTACGSETTLTGTSPADTAGDIGGTVQKAALTIIVSVSGEDSALASVLGSAAGVLRDADVTIERTGSSGTRQSAKTDAAGTVGFEELLPGSYSVSVIRVLTPAEVMQFSSEDADVNAFGGARTVTVEAPGTEAGVGAVAGRRGSLVISELSLPIARLPSGEDYRFGQWLELYNNSDTTIFLGGKLVIRGMIWTRDFSPPRDCANTAQWRSDPDGIWSPRLVQAFPGSSRSHPLRPGEAAVVALDAIDHRVFDPGLADLSGADFEFIGPADVDNPGAANMIRLGIVFGGGILNRGMEFGITDIIVILADQLDVDSLLRGNLPMNTREHWRIPREKILDVLTASPTPAVEAAQTFLFPLCDKHVNENFDRQRAALVDHAALNSIARRVFTTLPDGRKILLRTKTSSRDFTGATPSPGTIPD